MSGRSENRVVLSSFINDIRDDARDNSAVNSVETLVNDEIALHPAWRGVALDKALSEDPLEQRIFLALMSNPQFDALLLWQGRANEVCQVLEKCALLMPRLGQITFQIFPMSSEEADRIFTALRSAPSVDFMHFILRGEPAAYYDDVLRALSQYIQTSSSLRRIYLTCSNRVGSISLTSFASFCEAISESTGLRVFHMRGRLVDDSDTERAALYLATAVSKSSSLGSIRRFKGGSGSLTADPIFHALKQTDEAKELSVRFRRSERRHGVEGWSSVILIERDCWWKNVLPLEVRPNLWPLILEKANHSFLNEKSSHSHLDIINFLVREKSDVLLQNIHRRRTRKRKRYEP